MVDGAAAESAARDAGEAAAESRLAALRAALTEMRVALTRATLGLREAARALLAEQAEQDRGNASLDEALRKKDELEAAEKDMYRPLKDRSVTGPAAKKYANALLTLGRAHGFDEALLVGLPSALTKTENKRGPFEHMMLKAFEAQVSINIAELDKTLTEGAPEREERAAQVRKVQAAHDAAAEAHRAAGAEIGRAQAALEEGEVALRIARWAAGEFPPELQRVRT